VESNGSATHLIKLTAPTPAMFDLFGISVSQLDDRLAVGAYGASPNGVSQAGTVYFFQDSTWLPASPPTDLHLSSDTVIEGQPTGTLVGNLQAVDPNPGDVHSFALVGGTGSSGNSFFAIQGNRLETNASLSHDANATLSIRVRVTDAAIATFEKVLVINVATANYAPVFSSFDGNASVSLSRIENQRLVAELNATDADLDALYFSVSGGLDAALFEANASSGRLQFRVAPDFESPTNSGSDNLYLVQVEVSDGQATATQSIAVSVQDDDSEDVDGDGLTEGEEEAIGTSDFNADTDGDGFSDFDETIVPSDPLDPTIVPNRPPTKISLSSTMVLENQPVSTLVGDFSTEDPDPEDSHQYALVSGEGGGDNPVFQVVGSSIRTLAYFDFESKNLYQIRVRSTDDEGLSLEQALTIQVIDAFVPGVQTDQPIEVTIHSATLRGQLLDDGGLSLGEQGFLLSRSPLPVEGEDDTRVVSVSAMDQNGSFSVEVKDLVSGRRYYCRAFARNTEGTYYGETIRFATSFQKTIGIWSDAIAVDGAPDWYQSPWFGNVYLTGSNWIFHLDLGWLYLASSNREDVWLWSSRLGWVWTGASLYPYLYRHDDASWVYFMGNEFNQLFFYRFSDSQWLSFGVSGREVPAQ
jgi:hypothetical protein